MQHNGWDHALKVTADGKGLVGHAGAILLRKAADQAGLTAGLSGALRKKSTLSCKALEPALHSWPPVLFKPSMVCCCFNTTLARIIGKHCPTGAYNPGPHRLKWLRCLVPKAAFDCAVDHPACNERLHTFSNGGVWHY